MKRKWFRDDDGTFFRNVPLNIAEMDATPLWMFWRHRYLEREWRTVWDKGVIRKDRLGRRDVEVKMRSFREAYPDDPRIWTLDRGAS
jgi:hypothetical protein